MSGRRITEEEGEIYIPNCFIDLLLVVGLDEYSGLILSNGEPIESLELNDLVLQQYDPQVLTAVSSNAMMHFFPHPRPELDYPRVRHKKQDGKSLYTRVGTKSWGNMSRSKYSKTLHPARQFSVSSVTVSRHMSVRAIKQISKNVPEFPVSEEEIKNITTFCYPDGMKIYPTKQENVVHFLVLTDIMGNKTYATCLTFYRRFIFEKGDKSKLLMNLDVSADDLEHQQMRCYIPNCCVLISKYPYFTAMKDALSYMVSLMEADPEEMCGYIKDITHTLTITPVPLAGKIAVEIEIDTETINLLPPEKPNKPVIDIPLHLVFLCFHSNEILKILSAILLEERIVFISSSYALLTTVMQSFLIFILPFEWRYCFVPILTIEALELLEAPGTFMMGCHSVHRKEVEQIQGIVMVDIDEGVVHVNPVLEMSTNMNGSIESLHDIPDIPEECAKLFLNVCKRAMYRHDLEELQKPVCFDIKQIRQQQRDKVQKLNSIITEGCLELMVNIYRGVIPEIRVEHKRFNRQSFLDSLHGPEKKFYAKALKTDMFKSFLKDRMAEKSDYWSELEVMTRPQLKKSDSSRRSREYVIEIRKLRKQGSVTFLPGLLSRKDIKVFRMPVLQGNLKSYIHTTIHQLTDCYNESNDLQDKASFLYLRAVMYLADHKDVEALNDLTKLAEIDIALVPEQIVRQAYQRVPDSDMKQLQQRPEVQHLSELLQLDSDGGKPHHESHKFEEPIKLPDNDLSFDEFYKIVSLLEMSQDMETVMRLFTVLELKTHNGYDKINKETFEAFYHYYLENQKHCQMVDEEVLSAEEYVIKVSALCKTDAGSGRIILTNKRLLFSKDGIVDCTEIMKIRDIIDVERKQLKSFFKNINVLRMFGREDLKFTAWLKDERDHWYILLIELWSGKIVSMRTKDIMAASKAANNVQLIDAVLKSSEDAEVTHHNSVKEAVDQLCYFTKYREEKRHELPRETLETLVNRIDPNSGESMRQTIQSLLYTPGDIHHHVLPRLWCGMGDGKIKVFDAQTWNLESQYISTKSVVMCLADVGDNQVWAGSYYIYIIDGQTLRCNRAPLTIHGDAVVSIVVVDEGRFVYTASANGEILKWDVQTMSVQKTSSGLIPNLKTLKYCHDFLWCGTWQAIYKMDLEGNLLQTYSCQSEVDSFHIADNNQIWAGYRRSGTIVIMDSNTGEVAEEIEIDRCGGISAMVQQDNKLWVGTKDSLINIVNIDTKKVVKRLQAHDDAIRAMCCAENRYIISGAGSRDGRIAMWSATDTKTDSGSFVLDDT